MRSLERSRGRLELTFIKNIKEEFMTKDEAKHFLDDTVTHGYRIQSKLIDDMFKLLS